MPRVIGYIRVSTDEQHEEGGGLDAQRKSIRDACARRGWELVDILGEDSGASGGEIDRPGLNRARDAMDAGEADVLMVSKLDRLSRKTWQALQFIERAGQRQRKRQAWSFVTTEMDIDTTTSQGKLIITVMLAAAQYERDVNGDRTRAGMAAKKAAGTLKGPVGRPVRVPADVLRRIVADRAAGQSFGRIAEALNGDRVPLSYGGRAWYPSTVKRIVESEAAARLIA